MMSLACLGMREINPLVEECYEFYAIPIVPHTKTINVQKILVRPKKRGA